MNLNEVKIIDREFIETYFRVFDTAAQDKILEVLPTLDMTTEEKLDYIENEFGKYVHVQIDEKDSKTTIFLGTLADSKEAVLNHIEPSIVCSDVNYSLLNVFDLCKRFGLKLHFL